MTPTDLAAHLLTALLAVLPPIPMRGRVEARREMIVAVAAAGQETYGVPPALVLAVGFLESRWGTDARSGGSWGTPIDMQHRNVAGPPAGAARALASSFRVCGSWFGAVSRFRCGRCRCPRLVGYEPGYALGLAERTMARAGEPLPTGWR